MPAAPVALLNCTWSRHVAPGVRTPQLLNSINQPELEALTNTYPVFASQWSDGADDSGRASELAASIFSRYGIGWASGNWNAEPRLVANATAHQFTPTRWGLIAQRALALPVRPLLTAFPAVAIPATK